MNETDIRVGVIGYGYAGKYFHLPLIAATPGLSVVAVATSRPDSLAANYPTVAPVADPARLCARADLDLIVVATPNESHARWAAEALAQGKHVVVEKPFALTLTEAAGLAIAAKRADRLLTVFHNRRWDSDFLTMRAAIDSGILGRIVQFESRMERYRPVVRDRWRESALPGAGLWFDLAPHVIDQALLLFGLPEAVSLDLAAVRGGPANDWAHAVLHYPDLRVVIQLGMLAAHSPFRLLVHGTAGTAIKVRPDGQEAQLLAGMLPGTAEWGTDPDPLRLWDSTGEERKNASVSGDQRQFYTTLAAAIRGKVSASVKLEDALAVTSVINAALQAAASGQRTVIKRPSVPGGC